MSHNGRPTNNQIGITTAINNELEPKVVFKTGDRTFMIPPGDAHEMGIAIIRASERAERDAGLLKFLIQETKMKNEEALAFLLNFKKFLESPKEPSRIIVPDIQI